MSESSRPSWERSWFDVASVMSMRSTCLRAKVGAVIVDGNNRVLSTGYNGAPAGEPHCLDDGCLMDNNHCVRTIHAETNAVAYAARRGIAIEDASVYVIFANSSSGFTNWDSDEGATLPMSDFPCHTCRQVMSGAGIARVLMKSPYHEGVTIYE